MRSFSLLFDPLPTTPPHVRHEPVPVSLTWLPTTPPHVRHEPVPVSLTWLPTTPPHVRHEPVSVSLTWLPTTVRHEPVPVSLTRATLNRLGPLFKTRLCAGCPSNSCGVRVAIGRLPFPAGGLCRRKARARTLRSPYGRLSLGLAFCRPCPSAARRRCSSCSGLLVFPLFL